MSWTDEEVAERRKQIAEAKKLGPPGYDRWAHSYDPLPEKSFELARRYPDLSVDERCRLSTDFMEAMLFGRFVEQLERGVS